MHTRNKINEKNIAIIGASYLQLPLIRKAKDMGYTTHVFAWAANDVGEKEADFFYPISIVEKEEILNECRRIGIVGICSIASDLAAITVNYIADQLGLCGNSLDATARSTNKHLMRETFEQNGDPSSKSLLIDETTDLSKVEITFPAIVKPTDRSGSRGVFKVTQQSEISQAVINALEVSFEKKAIIEEFAEGQEYSVEYISWHGEHTFLAITQKFTTGAPHFIETGHLQPALISGVLLDRVKAVVEHALDSLGLKEGASHSEIKIDEDETIKIIEIGGRMGGDCIGSDLVHYSTGIDFVKAVIQVACGEEPDLSPDCEKQAAMVRFILTENDVEEFEELQREHPDRILQVVDECHKSMVGKTTDSSSRAGCYIIKQTGQDISEYK